MYVTEKFTMNSCIGIDKFRVVACQIKMRKVAITDEFLSTELIDAPGQLNGKLKSLQQNVVLQLSRKENLFFQLKALNQQFGQRNKAFKDGNFQRNLLRECAAGHKKSVVDLQRQNGKLMQLIDCLQDD